MWLTFSVVENQVNTKTRTKFKQVTERKLKGRHKFTIEIKHILVYEHEPRKGYFIFFSELSVQIPGVFSDCIEQKRGEGGAPTVTFQ